MGKRLIRLTESDLHRIVKESVQQILREMDGGAGLAAGGDNVTGANTADRSGQYLKGDGGIVDPNDPTKRRDNLCNFGKLGDDAV